VSRSKFKKIGKFTYNVTLRRVRVTTVIVEKGKRIICYECVFVAIVILHAIRMFRAVICGLSGYTCFFTMFSPKRWDFRGKMFLSINVCFDFLHDL